MGPINNGIVEKGNREPENVLSLVASAILGLALGEVMYVAVGGRIPESGPVLPWYLALGFAVGALAWAARESNRALRAALVIFAIGQMWPYVQVSTDPAFRWALRIFWSIALGLLVHVAFWRVTRTRLKVVALIVSIACVPIRYWSISNWHALVDRYRVTNTRKEIVDGPSTTRQPTKLVPNAIRR